MTCIHPCHRRLAELTAKAKRNGGFHSFTTDDWRDFEHCLRVNEDFVMKLSFLEQLSLIAYNIGDTEYQHEICAKIEKLTGRW